MKIIDLLAVFQIIVSQQHILYRLLYIGHQKTVKGNKDNENVETKW